MKTAVFLNNIIVSNWFDEYLDAINHCLNSGVLCEITDTGYVLAKGYTFKYN